MPWPIPLPLIVKLVISSFPAEVRILGWCFYIYRKKQTWLPAGVPGFSFDRAEHEAT